jgi:hypothetical protein
MRYIKATTEDDMVASFLKAEISSTRYSKKILGLLRRDGVDRKVIEYPDLDNHYENLYRIRLLGDFRGYKQQRDHFKGFPDNISWQRVTLNREELAKVQYINYLYWIAISNGSRLPIVAAKNILAGKKVFGESTKGFLEIAQLQKNWETIPELILVGKNADSRLVLLEGHVRLTVYFLVPESIPDELNVIMGISPNIAQWKLY